MSSTATSASTCWNSPAPPDSKPGLRVQVPSSGAEKAIAFAHADAYDLQVTSHALFEAADRPLRRAIFQCGVGAKRGAREDPRVVDRADHQLGANARGEEGARAASRQIVRAGARTLRRHAADDYGAGQWRARDRQPRVLHAADRDPECRNERLAGDRRRAAGRRRRLLFAG